MIIRMGVYRKEIRTIEFHRLAVFLQERRHCFFLGGGAVKSAWNDIRNIFPLPAVA